MKEMQQISRQRHRGAKYHYAETVTDTTSEALIVPVGVSMIAVAVTPGTSATVQFTLSDYDAIEAGTAVWHDWPEGEVSSKAADTVDGSVSALRLISSGASDWEVTA